MKNEPEIEDAEITDLATIENVLGPMPKGNTAFLDLKPIYDMRIPENGRYRFDQKVEAIVHLTAHMEVNEASLEIEPDFREVATYLSISSATLRKWWTQREEILTTAGTLAGQIAQASTIKNMVIKQQAQESLINRDFDEVSVKDLVLLLKTLTVMDHINLNGGVSKVVKHEHRIAFVMPDSSK